jgi:hypothetical protein
VRSVAVGVYTKALCMAREIHVRAGLEIRQIILAASIYCIGSTCLCTNELSGIAAVIIIINSMSVAHGL